MKSGSERLKKDEDAELSWDLIDRCLLPLVFSHAAAVISAFVLNNLYISQISFASLFIIYFGLTLAVTLFYHNLSVTCAGKCVVLSGCENKVGYSIAKFLDDLGLTVYAGFSKDSDNKLKLKVECSGRLQAIDLDITSDESIKLALEYISEQSKGKIWAVINAASWPSFGEAEWVSSKVIRKTLELNLIGSIALTNAFLPLIRKSKGRIINITSIYGKITTGIRTPICIATSSLGSYTECLHLDMRKWGVDVILIESGLKSTGLKNFWFKFYFKLAAWYNNQSMLDEARTLWSGLPKQVQEIYGQEYFEKQITKMKEYQSCQEDLTALLKTVGDAVSRTFPLSVYTPVTKKEKLQVLIANHFPRSVYAIIYN